MRALARKLSMGTLLAVFVGTPMEASAGSSISVFSGGYGAGAGTYHHARRGHAGRGHAGPGHGPRGYHRGFRRDHRCCGGYNKPHGGASIYGSRARHDAVIIYRGGDYARRIHGDRHRPYGYKPHGYKPHGYKPHGYKPYERKHAPVYKSPGPQVYFHYRD